MEFNLRARSFDVLMPVHHFAGDEAITLETYEQCMTGGYMSTLSFILGGAQTLGLEIDAETLERWKRICSTAYLIDDFVDNAPDTAAACDIYEASMGRALELTNTDILDVSNLPPGADEKLLPAIVLMKNSIATFTDERMMTLKDSAMDITAIARLKINCDTVPAYVSLLAKEAHSTSNLITESASDAVRSQTPYLEFQLWFRRLMQMAILGDSVIDLRDDSKQHVTEVIPTVRNMAKIALHAFAAARTIVHDSPQRRATIGSLLERSKFYR